MCLTRLIQICLHSSLIFSFSSWAKGLFLKQGNDCRSGGKGKTWAVIFSKRKNVRQPEGLGLA